MNTYYLDETIELTMFTEGEFVANKVYNYRIYRYNVQTHLYDEILYVGQLYIPRNAESVTVEISEVLKMYKADIDEVFDEYDNNFEDMYDNQLYKCIVYGLDGVTVLAAQEFFVRMIYRYPNKNFDYTLPNSNDNVTKNAVLLKPNNDFIVPHYPYKATEEFKMSFAYYTPIALATQGRDVYIKGNGIELDGNHYVEYEDGGHVMFQNKPLSEYLEGSVTTNEKPYLYITDSNTVGYKVVADGLAEEVTEGEALAFLEERMSYEDADALLQPILAGDETVIFQSESEAEASAYYIRANGYFNCWVDTVEGDTEQKLVELDVCPKRFYLQWQDRSGQIQCQSFDGADEYKENVETIAIQQFINRERKIYWAVEPKWKLRTGWMDDDTYQYYESIFVSPYINLYDTKEDKSYRVLLEDTTYTEKKWENQYSLFNIEINLRENKKQHIFN